MGKKVTNYLTLLVLSGMALILLLNISKLFTQQKVERYLSYNGVRGIAVEHQRKLWTLNFDQQNRVIEDFNLALPIGRNTSHLEKKPLPVDRIVIYRFKGPDLFVTPVGYDGYNLVFDCKEWNPSGYLLDVSGGSLDTLLRSSYDP
jgi:hypothetical protein